MAPVLQSKVVSALPTPLTADTVYYVRVGTGFDIYVTNHSGTVVASPLNPPTPLDPDGYPYPPNSASLNIVTAAGATQNSLGPGTTTAGTVTSGTIAATNYRTSLLRQQAVSALTAGSPAGPRGASLQYWRGNASGLGGFDVMIRCALTVLTGHQVQIGLATLDISADPSTLGSSICLAADATDVNLQWLTRDGTTANKVDTGIPKTTTNVLRVRFVAAANGSSVAARLYDESAGALLSTAALSTNLPASTSFMTIIAKARNGATTTAAQLDFLRWVGAGGS
ncbi:hypothetical protein [Deinococcus alpinitundrae]|uniref:hypothetical protein n=1 Tax=Deinococcus alpinitundrae TaxID=468913 RepID=UPI001379884E|nr:hypothetical protein [Deinococcus alpinitundrae]